MVTVLIGFSLVGSVSLSQRRTPSVVPASTPRGPLMQEVYSTRSRSTTLMKTQVLNHLRRRYWCAQAVGRGAAARPIPVVNSNAVTRSEVHAEHTLMEGGRVLSKKATQMGRPNLRGRCAAITSRGRWEAIAPVPLDDVFVGLGPT